MRRRDDLTRRLRRLARTALDRGAAVVDQLGDLVRGWLSSEDAEPTAPEPDAPLDPPDLSTLSKAELYEMAQRLDIAGRSKLTKDELRAAVAAALD